MNEPELTEVENALLEYGFTLGELAWTKDTGTCHESVSMGRKYARVYLSIPVENVPACLALRNEVK